MIGSNLTLEIIEEYDLPCQDIRAGEVVLAHTVMQHDALLHIANPDGYILGLGKRGALKFYDLDKLDADNIYVNRRNYGGSGAMLGPKDVVFSLHVNKNCFIDGYSVNAAHAYRFFNWALCSAVNEFTDVHLDEGQSRQREDGVCIHLQGRSEIVTPEGSKMAVSVYREDEVGFYMNGAILVSDAWADIYDYLISPIDRDRVRPDSLERRTGRKNLTGAVKIEVIDHMAQHFADGVWCTKPAQVHAAISGIRDQFRVRHGRNS